MNQLQNKENKATNVVRSTSTGTAQHQVAAVLQTKASLISTAAMIDRPQII